MQIMEWYVIVLYIATNIYIAIGAFCAIFVEITANSAKVEAWVINADDTEALDAINSYRQRSTLSRIGEMIKITFTWPCAFIN